jgi:hypothetical protein
VDGRESGVPLSAEARDFSLFHRVQTGSSHIMGIRALSLGIKWQGREADHSPPSSAQVKNGGDVSLLSTRLYGVVLD